MSISAFARNPQAFERAKALVSYYYYTLPLAALLFLGNPVTGRYNFEPFGPLSWIQFTQLSYPEIVLLLKVVFTLISILATVGFRHWFVRVLVFVVLLHIHAFESSFGSVNHQWYLYLYSSFFFIFIPNVWNKDTYTFETRRLLLLLIWFSQAFVMLIYSMAGMWKFYFDIVQYSLGQVHGFAIHAFAYQVANWVPRLQEEALLAPYVIAYPEIAWPFYIALQFLQFFALWTMVRPSLQVIWVPLLILFHIGTLLTMGISFFPMVFVVSLLFFHSPFTLGKMRVSEIVRDLPLVTQVITFFKRKTLKIETKND